MHLWFPRNTHSLIKRTAAPCDPQKLYISGGHKGPPEIIYFCKFRLKKGPEIMRKLLANTEFSDRQWDASPLQAPKSYVRINFDRKGTENCAFMFPKNTFF